MTIKPTKLIFTDIETTGLNPKKDVILQVAYIITDFQFNELAFDEVTIHHPASVKDLADDYVKNMHTKNGLWDAVNNSLIEMTEAEALLTVGFKAVCGEKEAYMAGNSIHFDRGFLAEQMPSFPAHAHYRQVDFSTVSILAQNWTNLRSPMKKKNHTAREDILETIEEAKFFYANLFSKEAT